MVGLSVAAWILASTSDTGDDDNGRVGDAASPEPTATSSTPRLEAKIDRYVALGDSITSAPYLPEVDEAGGCFRSSQNYPSLVAEELTVRDFVDVSCGGAGSEEMRESQFAGVPPQLEAVTRDTDLVTLTLGANDFDIYRAIVIGCYNVAVRDPEGTPCRDEARAGGQDRLLDWADQIGPRIESVLDEVHRRAPDARVVLLGYPRLFPEGGTCTDLPFAEGDYAYINTVMTHLRDVQRAAAEATDTDFVDMHELSAGHDACSSDPWMLGRDPEQPQGTAPYHAFPAGQRAMADALLELLDS